MYVEVGAVIGGEEVVVVGWPVVVVVVGRVVVAGGAVVVVVVVVEIRVEVVDGWVLLVEPPPHPAMRTEMTRVAVTATRDAPCEQRREHHRGNTREQLIQARRGTRGKPVRAPTPDRFQTSGEQSCMRRRCPAIAQQVHSKAVESDLRL